jgi:Glycosyl transferase family 90
MEQLLRALKYGGGTLDRERIPILWSESRREHLSRTASGEVPSQHQIDSVLANPLLGCAEGRFAEAERVIVDLLEQNAEVCRRGGETFISLLNALFVVQRFDLLAALLRVRFQFARELEITAQRDGPGIGRVGWEILSTGVHRFTFDAKAFENDNTRIEILAFQWAFPIYANYARLDDQEIGSVVINQQDIGRTPGLAWCDNRPDYFLVPDCIFVPSEGYSYARQVYRQNRVAWNDRAGVALWRGATTGIPAAPGDWRSLERVRLCELARRHAHSGLIDAGISSIIQFNDPAVVQQIRDSGLVRGPIPWQEWGRYKYQIDIDGNSSPWSNLFQRLLTGSPVLKVESSRGLQQWFYDELVPWQNYVPIAPDMSDLIDKVGWLSRNDAVAQRIGLGGSALAEHLTYEREIGRSAAVVGSAFRHFNRRSGWVGPFGRKLSGEHFSAASAAAAAVAE